MNIVRERLNEIKKQGNPLNNLGVGRRHMISTWCEDNLPRYVNYIINTDLSIDADYISVTRELPDYIKYNKVSYFNMHDSVNIFSVLPNKVLNEIVIKTNTPSIYNNSFIEKVKSKCNLLEFTDIFINGPDGPKNLSSTLRKKLLGPIAGRSKFIEDMLYRFDETVSSIKYAPGYVTYYQLKYLEEAGDKGRYYVNVYEISDILRKPLTQFIPAHAGSHGEPWKTYVDFIKEGWYKINDKGRAWMKTHEYFEREKPDLSKFVEYQQRKRKNI